MVYNSNNNLYLEIFGFHFKDVCVGFRSNYHEIGLFGCFYFSSMSSVASTFKLYKFEWFFILALT